jgi:hypothetical protein
MPIDAYSLCPGGTGKKIKFCCGDFLHELEKIDRLLDADQTAACLQRVEQLLAGGPPRACLLAVKGMLLRAGGQFEAAAANATVFLQRFPGNPVALAESAILAAIEGQAMTALPQLLSAMATGGDEMENRVYQAMGVVADCLLDEGRWHAGRALLHTQMLLADDDPAPAEKLLEVNRASRLPPILKDDPPLSPAPEGSPWAERLDAAMKPLADFRWQEVAQRLAKLADEIPDAPVVWRNLAVLRSWLADQRGMIDALRKFAALAAPLEDAVEAETLAMLLDSDPLGDLVDVLKLTWTVRDAQRLQDALLAEPRLVQVPVSPAAAAGSQTPPPRMMGAILDRRTPDSDTITLETMPQVVAETMLFGPQTDRPARLVVQGISADQAPSVSDWLLGVAGDAIDPQPQRLAAGKMSATRDGMQHKWYPPQSMAPERLIELIDQRARRFFLEQWPARPLGCFGGQSPREAAADPAQKIKLLAAVMLLESWQQDVLVKFDFNDVRRALGLPTLEPLDLAEGSVAALPLVRLGRVAVEKLSDKDLVRLFHRARMYAAREALRNSAQEIVRRDSMAGNPERLRAYAALARTAEDFPQAQGYVEQGRQAAIAAGQSCASWDLLELSFCFTHGGADRAQQLLQHIQSRHMSERGVAEALTQMLVDVGALRPDGTPARPSLPEEALALAEGPAAAAPGKLWTPDSPQSGGGKIWTPG